MNAGHAAQVETFAVPHRARETFWRLLAAGSVALPAVRAGLHHVNAGVRSWCCRLLDHFVDGDGMDELVAMLDDPDPQVRSLHALGCNNCKEDAACRIDSAAVLPRAIEMLRSGGVAHVRTHAVCAGRPDLQAHRAEAGPRQTISRYCIGPDAGRRAVRSKFTRNSAANRLAGTRHYLWWKIPRSRIKAAPIHPLRI